MSQDTLLLTVVIQDCPVCLRIDCLFSWCVANRTKKCVFFLKYISAYIKENNKYRCTMVTFFCVFVCVSGCKSVCA